MYKLKQCALCGAETQLELSHVVPKMVVRYLKKTAIGKIRNTQRPNVPIQDSEKHYMLCSDCEDSFCDYETYFANLMFFPYQKKEKLQFDYNSRLFYFLTSLSWRSLYLDILDFVENHVVGIEALECLIACENDMREYLLGIRSDIGQIEHHIFFFEELREAYGDMEIADLRPNVSFHRGITSYTFCCEKEHTYATITNMMGIIAVTLYRKGIHEQWSGTQIVRENGHVEAKGQHINSVVGNEFINILKTIHEASVSIGARQKEQIVERITAVGASIKSYPIFEDILNDQNIKRN